MFGGVEQIDWSRLIRLIVGLVAGATEKPKALHEIVRWILLDSPGRLIATTKRASSRVRDVVHQPNKPGASSGSTGGASALWHHAFHSALQLVLTVPAAM